MNNWLSITSVCGIVLLLGSFSCTGKSDTAPSHKLATSYEGYPLSNPALVAEWNASLKCDPESDEFQTPQCEWKMEVANLLLASHHLDEVPIPVGVDLWAAKIAERLLETQTRTIHQTVNLATYLAFRAARDNHLESGTMASTILEDDHPSTNDPLLAYTKWKIQNASSLGSSHLRRALAGLSNHAPLLYDYAQALARSGFIDRAHKEFERVLALSPDSTWAYLAIAVIHREQGNSDQFLRICHKIQAIDPDDPALLLSMGSHYMEEKAPQIAIQFLDKHHGLRPAHQTGVKLLVRALLQNSNVNEALKLSKKFQFNAGDDPIDIRLSLFLQRRDKWNWQNKDKTLVSYQSDKISAIATVEDAIWEREKFPELPPRIHNMIRSLEAPGTVMVEYRSFPGASPTSLTLMVDGS